MFIEHLQMRGQLALELYGPDGRLKERRQLKNLITTTGKNWEAGYLGDSPGANMGWIAVGTGTATAALGDTALGTELSRVAAGRSVSGSVITYAGTFGAGTATGAITEYGLFNASGSAAGTIFSRVVDSVVNKGASDTLTVSWAQTKG